MQKLLQATCGFVKGIQDIGNALHPVHHQQTLGSRQAQTPHLSQFLSSYLLRYTTLLATQLTVHLRLRLVNEVILIFDNCAVMLHARVLGCSKLPRVGHLRHVTRQAFVSKATAASEYVQPRPLLTSGAPHDILAAASQQVMSFATLTPDSFSFT
jgi:hypothetical protein